MTNTPSRIRSNFHPVHSCSNRQAGKGNEHDQIAKRAFRAALARQDARDARDEGGGE